MSIVRRGEAVKLFLPKEGVGGKGLFITVEKVQFIQCLFYQ